MELHNKREEILYRIRRKKSLDDKIEHGRKLEKEFIEILESSFPLFKYGEEPLIELLRQGEAEHYYYTVDAGKIYPSHASKTKAKKVSRDDIKKTINALINLEQIKSENSYNELARYTEFLFENLPDIEGTENKIEHLIELRFSKNVEEHPRSEFLQAAIDDKIHQIENLNQQAQLDFANIPRLGLDGVNITPSAMTEIINGVCKQKGVVNLDENRYATDKEIILAFSAMFNMNLNNYYDLLKKALLSHKRSKDNKTFTSVIDAHNKQTEKELREKEALREERAKRNKRT